MMKLSFSTVVFKSLRIVFSVCRSRLKKLKTTVWRED